MKEKGKVSGNHAQKKRTFPDKWFWVRAIMRRSQNDINILSTDKSIILESDTKAEAYEEDKLLKCHLSGWDCKEILLHIDTPVVVQTNLQHGVGVLRFLRGNADGYATLALPTSSYSIELDTCFIPSEVGVKFPLYDLYPSDTVDTWDRMWDIFKQHIVEHGPYTIQKLSEALQPNEEQNCLLNTPIFFKRLIDTNILQHWRMTIATEVALRLHFADFLRELGGFEQLEELILILRKTLSCLAMPDGMYRIIDTTQAPRQLKLCYDSVLYDCLETTHSAGAENEIFYQKTAHEAFVRNHWTYICEDCHLSECTRQTYEASAQEVSTLQNGSSYSSISIHKIPYLGPPPVLSLHPKLDAQCVGTTGFNIGKQSEPCHVTKFNPIHVVRSEGRNGHYIAPESFSFPFLGALSLRLRSLMHPIVQDTLSHCDSNDDTVHSAPTVLWDFSADSTCNTIEMGRLSQSVKLDRYWRLWRYHCLGLSHTASCLRLIAKEYNLKEFKGEMDLTCAKEDAHKMSSSRIDASTYLPPPYLLQEIQKSKKIDLEVETKRDVDHFNLPYDALLNLLNSLTSPIYELVIDYLAPTSMVFVSREAEGEENGSDIRSKTIEQLLLTCFDSSPNDYLRYNPLTKSIAMFSNIQPLECPLTIVCTLVPPENVWSFDNSRLNDRQRENEQELNHHRHQIITIASFDLNLKERNNSDPPGLWTELYPKCKAALCLVRCLKSSLLPPSDTSENFTINESSLLPVINPVNMFVQRNVENLPLIMIGRYLKNVNPLKQFDLSAPWIPDILPIWARTSIILDVCATCPTLPNALQITIILLLHVFMSSSVHIGTIPKDLTSWLEMCVGRCGKSLPLDHFAQFGMKACPSFEQSLKLYLDLLQDDASLGWPSGAALMERLGESLENKRTTELLSYLSLSQRARFTQMPYHTGFTNSDINLHPWCDLLRSCQVPTLQNMCELMLSNTHSIPKELQSWVETLSSGAQVNILYALFQLLLVDAAWIGDPYANEMFEQAHAECLEWCGPYPNECTEKHVDVMYFRCDNTKE